jgi:uncharacterized protein
MTSLRETPARALMPDYLRLFALFGMVVVNVQYIGFSVLHGIAEPIAETAVDTITLWLVNGLALLKTYGLFSFMFGVGLGFLMRSTARRELSFGRVYRNRIVGLLILGIAHGCLFFPGDILAIYAITGSILYLCRDWPVRRLVQVGAALLVLQAVIVPSLLIAAPQTPPNIVALEREILTEGGFLEATLLRSIGFAFIMPSFLVVQGTAALGSFYLGLAAVKSGMIDDTGHPLWRHARHWGFGLGVVLGLAGAALWQWGPTVPGVVLTIATAPIATVGYLGVIAALSRIPGPIMAKALAAGGSSLSIYLGQSIILSTICSGYGFGLWGAVDRLTATIIGIIVTLFLIGTILIWKAYFTLGPFEWALRWVTYWKRCV